MPREMCSGTSPNGAVVHEEAGVEEAHLDRPARPRVDRRVGGATALPGDGVEVDVVGHGVGGRVGEREAHHVADAGADDRARRTGQDLLVAGELVAPGLVLDAAGRIDDGHLLDDLEHDRAIAGVVRPEGGGTSGAYEVLTSVSGTRGQLRLGDEVRDDRVRRGLLGDGASRAAQCEKSGQQSRNAAGRPPRVTVGADEVRHVGPP